MRDAPNSARPTKPVHVWGTENGGEEDESPYRTYIGLPAVLDMHMWFAVMMLGLIVVQIGSITLASRGVPGSDYLMAIHKKAGPVTLFVILLASGLGTISLALCDIQPKRGAENLFFVAIGVGILVSLLKGVYAVSHGRPGLHFQYMTLCVGLVFSPGWNRITTVAIRLYLLVFHEVSQECFVANTWAQHGYLYVWSFVAGMSSLLFWWMAVFRAPIFKSWSAGFVIGIVLAALLVACLWQTFYSYVFYSEPMIYVKSCSPQDHQQWVNFTSAMRSQALFTASKGYGVCTTNLWSQPQGSFKTSDFDVMRLRVDDPIQQVGYV